MPTPETSITVESTNSRKDQTTVLSVQQFTSTVHQIQCSQCGVTDEWGGSKFDAASSFMKDGWKILEDKVGTEESWCPDCAKGCQIHD